MIAGKKGLLSNRNVGIILLIPAFVLIGSIIVLPLVDAVRMSFTKTSFLNIQAQKYVGLRNDGKILT